MNLDLDLILRRICSAVSTIRTQAETARRHEDNGGTPADVTERYQSAAVALEEVARRLESAIVEP